MDFTGSGPCGGGAHGRAPSVGDLEQPRTYGGLHAHHRICCAPRCRRPPQGEVLALCMHR
jgi:hypothetical protein